MYYILRLGDKILPVFTFLAIISEDIRWYDAMIFRKLMPIGQEHGPLRPAEGRAGTAPKSHAEKLHTFPFMTWNPRKRGLGILQKPSKILTKNGIASRAEKGAKFNVLPSAYYIISILLNRKQGNLPAFLPEISPKMGQEA